MTGPGWHHVTQVTFPQEPFNGTVGGVPNRCSSGGRLLTPIAEGVCFLALRTVINIELATG